MTWFRVDDDLAFHRKTVKAGNAAMGLWVRAGAWCAQQLNDGHVPHDIARTMGKPSEIKALVNAELWENDGDSYVFHDWFVRNPSRTDVEERRAAEAKKKADWRAKRAGQRGLSTGDKTGDANVSPEGVPGGVPALSTSTRPDPTRPSTSSNEEVRKNSADASAPDRFDEFWSAYPRKTAKRNAEKAWKAAVKRAEPSVILAGLRRAKFSDDSQFIAHPATWLNGDRWADQAQTSLTLLPTSDGFTAAELDQILGPPRPLPQPPRGLDENAMWEWEQQTRREQRAERVRQANVKLGRSA